MADATLVHHQERGRQARPTDAARARTCLELIATIADALDRECHHQAGAVASSPEAARLLLLRLRDAACQIGWTADRGAALLGGTEARGDADWWLLPPEFRGAHGASA